MRQTKIAQSVNVISESKNIVMQRKKSMARHSATAKRSVKVVSNRGKRPTKAIGAPLPKPCMLVIGDVIGMPLSSETYAYLRRYRDVRLGLLDLAPTHELLSIESIRQRAPRTVAFCEYYEPYDQSPWLYVGEWAFGSPEQGSAPPVYIQDIVDPERFRLLVDGNVVACSKADTFGLEPHLMRNPTSIRTLIEQHFRHNSDNQQQAVSAPVQRK